MLFKGYVPTKNKTCLIPFKNKSSSELKTLEEVQSLSEYAGILADETILIDIDNAEQSELLMNIVEVMQLDCRVYQTTRGRHFLFRNNGVDKCGTQ
jgi:putative DNA primase/helicase